MMHKSILVLGLMIALYLGVQAIEKLLTTEIHFDQKSMGEVAALLQGQGYQVSFEAKKVNLEKDRIVNEMGITINWKKHRFSVSIKEGASIEEALNMIVKQDPDYTWARHKNSDMYIIFPISDEDSTFMWETEPINVKNKKLKDVFSEDLKVSEHKIYVGRGYYKGIEPRLEKEDQQTYERKITANIPKLPFREVLNEIIASEPDLFYVTGGLSTTMVSVRSFRWERYNANKNFQQGASTDADKPRR